MEEEEGARRGGGWTEEEEGAEEEGKKAGNRGERRASTADSAAPPGPRTPPEPGARAGTLQKRGTLSPRLGCPFPPPRAWWRRRERTASGTASWNWVGDRWVQPLEHHV